jgi:hypothetical protein
MSYRVQYTPFSKKEFAAAGQFEGLRNELRRDMADEAELIIHQLATYPGEVEAGGNISTYRRTGVLKLRNARLLTTNRRGQTIVIDPKNDKSGLFSGGYERTGQLGLAWSYDIRDNAGGSLTLVFTNVAHDRPGNYYAGWVHGLNAPGANAKYYQVKALRDIGWKSFPEALEEHENDFKNALQDTINDYFKRMGIML